MKDIRLQTWKQAGGQAGIGRICSIGRYIEKL